MGNLKRLEYVWLDGYNPANLRSKVKMVDSDYDGGADAPDWSFDGSSTKQADGGSSDCVLKPIRTYNNPINDGYIVLCEVYTPDGKPHLSNTRAKLSRDDEEYWWGLNKNIS